MVYLGKIKRKRISKKEEKALKKQASILGMVNNNHLADSEHQQEPNKEKKIIKIPKALTVKEFSDKLEIPVTKVITCLMKNGVMASINESIDYETAMIVGDELGFDVKCEDEKKKETRERTNQKPRPLIVVVLGHVDHGKTTLLDSIRKTDIVSGESGGITQHIGAYQVKIRNPKLEIQNKKVKLKNKIINDLQQEDTVTFLDTPGHEAFSVMRAHGANITDLAILVVAADDGVKPQTKEAISHARAAGIPIIVAINKIDKPGADIEKVERELAEMGLNPEKWGGDTVMVPVSAKTKNGIDDLLEAIMINAELIGPKAQYQESVEGVVIESHIQSGLGPVATVLVKHGTLKIGDFLVIGDWVYGKVKSMEDFRGKKILQAYPSMPVKISGLTNVPEFGDIVKQVFDERTAKNMTNVKKRKTKLYGIHEISEAVRSGELTKLPIILKTDVQGSLKAITGTLEQLGNEKVKVNLILADVGAINESDINMAVSGNNKALIIGFRVPIPMTIKKIAEEKGIKIANYDIIYRLTEDIQAALSGMLKPEIEKVIVGKLEVLKVFHLTTDRKVIGGKVIDGKIIDKERIDIYHSGEIIGQGKINSLEKDKAKIKEVKRGHECGLVVSTKTKIKPGDLIEVFKEEERKIELL